MKKVLALVLAVVLAFGMATVAFAADTSYAATLNTTTAYGANPDGYVDSGNVIGHTVKPGTTMYFPIALTKTVGTATNPSVKLSDLGDYRISYSIDEGKNMIESVKFVQAKDLNKDKGLYVAVKLKDNFIMESQDVIATIDVVAKKNAEVNGFDKDTINLDIVADYDHKDVSNGYVDATSAEIFTFDEDADDVVLYFDEDVEIAGNFKGQKDVFLRMGTRDDKLTDKYPDASIRYFDGNKDTFKREVTVTIPYVAATEKDPYIYENVNGKLTLVKDAKYADEAFTFKTKTMGNYVISDVALKDVVEDEKTEGEGTTGTETNPETGANDFVGLAVALAVVSVAGIAVAKK